MTDALHERSSALPLWRIERCMDHVEMEEIHNSLEELVHPPLFSLKMRGDSSMSHSICMSKTYGKVIVCLHNDLYNVYMHPLTIHVQDVTPRRSILFSRLHGLLEAISSVGDGHSLGGLGEALYFAKHAHFAPYTIHFLQTCEEIGVESKWLRSHIIFHFMLQLRVKLCWLHLRDHCPYPDRKSTRLNSSHLTASRMPSSA